MLGLDGDSLRHAVDNLLSFVGNDEMVVDLEPDLCGKVQERLWGLGNLELDVGYCGRCGSGRCRCDDVENRHF